MRNSRVISGAAVFIYLITISIGTLGISKSNFNEYQIFIALNLISFSFFWAISPSSIKFCVDTFRNNIILSVKFLLYLTLMFMPIYLTQKNGVTGLFYCEDFSIVLSLLAFLHTKKYFRALFFFFCLFCLMWYKKFEIYHLITIIGPFGAYQMLTVSRVIATRTNASTNKIMLFRYFILGVFSILLIPFLNFHTSLFTVHQVIMITVIAFSLNIIPIYCAQYVTLSVGSDFFAKGAGLLPLVIFSLGHLFYSIPFNAAELIAALFIAFPIGNHLSILFYRKLKHRIIMRRNNKI